MSLWKIAWRSLQQRALSSWLTGLSMALGVALVICVLVIHGVISRSFANAAQGYHLILGAKGGKLQLVLNTVFHLSQPIENVPYSFYKEFIEYEDKDGKLVPGKYAPQVRVAVPYCLGDSYKNFRVVGTTPDLFDKLSYGAYKNGTPKTYKWAAGENFDPKDFSAAVIGSVAAYKTGLKVGDRFPITHGVADDENSHVHEEDLFHVTGILEPTGTPNDRAVFVNMEGFYLISDHARPVDKKEPTAEERESARQTEKLKEARGQLAEAAHGTNVPAPVAERIGKAEQLVNSVIKALGSDEVDDHEHDHAAEHTDDSHDEHHGDHADDGHSSAHDVPAEQPADEHQHEHNDHDHEDHGHDDHGHDHSHDHGHHHHENREPLPEAQREVTAILVLMKNDLYSNLVYNKVNEGNVAQAVFPAREVATLFEGVVGHVQMILLVLAALVVVVAGIGVMVSIYNSMSDRSREIGIMRALGAGRSTVMMVVLLESILLALLGGFAGVLIGHGAIGALSPLIVAQTGVSVGPFQFETNELILVPALIILAALVGYLPALVAYRTDVAKALARLRNQFFAAARSMNSKSNRLACLTLVLATVLRGQLVGACSICSSTSPTLCDNIEPADVAVFAAYIGPSKDNPDGIERSEFRIEQIIKGREALGDERVARVLFFPPPDLRPGTMFLVLGNAIPKVRWTTPIRVSKRSIKYIRRMLELPPEGAERLAYALEYIDDTEELMRKDAYDEFGKAPYSMLANLRSNLDADALLGAVQDPKTEAFSLMRLKFTLLSVCVRSQDLPALEKIVRSHGDQYKQCLDAMIACYLNAAGAEGLGVIEAEYLNSEEPDDLTAASSAISALRFHGQENDVIDRDRIIELMRRLLAKPQLAGWIVSDLARWEDWSVLDRVAQLFREADEEDTKWLREPAARYVLACPLPAAKELLPQLEKIDPDSLRVARRMLVRETAAKTDKIEKRDQPDKQDILAGNKETGPPPEPTDGSQNSASGGPNWYVIGGALAAFVVILLLARRRGSPEVTNAS